MSAIDLARGFARLERREALAIILTYVVGLTLRELGQVFEVSGAQAWTIRRNGESKLAAIVQGRPMPTWQELERARGGRVAA